MKKINIYIVGLLCMLISFSCNDAIEITQPGRFSAENAFQSVEDLGLGLLGAYNQMDITDEIFFTATFTDEISIATVNGGQGTEYFNYILNSNSDIPFRTWTHNYDAINASTRLIEASSLITPSAGQQAEYDNILGQAYAIRAWAHFMLFSYYTTDYTNDAALSVIAVNFVPELDATLGRNTVGEVVALIQSDLASADNLLSDAFDNVTFINKDFVTALLARLATYRQDYTTAAVLASSLADRYPLADQDQFFNMWEDADPDNTGIIFKLERSVGDDYDVQATDGGGTAGSLFAFVSATLDGAPFLEMGRALYNCIDENDIRLSRMIDESSLIDPGYATNPDFINSDQLVIRKYPGSDGRPLMNDLKIFRSAEMVLIQAEAAAANGDLSGAAGFVKKIRDARLGSDQPTPDYSSTTAAFRDILKERRVELAYEAHRYLDLKRLGERAGVTIDRDPLDCAMNNSCNFSITDYRWTLPIPQVEFNANPVIRDQQNPGY